MPTPIIAGNWKMNTTLQEARDLVSGIMLCLGGIEGVQTVICPPFTSLSAVADILRGSSVSLGAQNMHYEDRGAFTGEVSPTMLAELCQFVILGHSERRQVFGETDEQINMKVRAALKAGLRPILCVGEQLDQREQGNAEATVEMQITGCLGGISEAAGLSIAYEPVWAIGTGRAATPEVAQEMMAHIRSVLGTVRPGESADEVPLLYGGSVNSANVSEYMGQPDVNGALVGGASLDGDSFLQIVQLAAQAGS